MKSATTTEEHKMATEFCPESGVPVSQCVGCKSRTLSNTEIVKRMLADPTYSPFRIPAPTLDERRAAMIAEITSR